MNPPLQVGDLVALRQWPREVRRVVRFCVDGVTIVVSGRVPDGRSWLSLSQVRAIGDTIPEGLRLVLWHPTKYLPPQWWPCPDCGGEGVVWGEDEFGCPEDWACIRCNLNGEVFQ